MTRSGPSGRTIAWLAVAVIAMVLIAFAIRGLPALLMKGGAPAAPSPRPELALERTPEYDYDPPEPGSYQLPVLSAAADGPVIHADGTPGRLKQAFDGHITVLSFIYTRCADPTACPLATGVLRGIHRLTEQDSVLARNLRLVTFSFDPEHDTPERMAAYEGVHRGGEGGAEWWFLTTASNDLLRPILASYGQRVDPKKNPDDPLGPLNHLLRVYLIDREGKIRNIYSTGMLDPRLVVADVRTLMLERS